MAMSGDCPCNGHDHATAIGIKVKLTTGIADFAHGLTDELLDVDVTVDGHFAHHDHKTSGGCGFAGHPGAGVDAQKGIKYRVRDLVTQLVWMCLWSPIQR
jgi:hypothetical protein